MTAPETHDAYLADLPDDQRDALQALRATVRARLPDAVECISYAMPAFRQGAARGKGKVVAGYAAFSRHCGFYPFSGSVIPLLERETAGFRTSRSGVLFTPDHPLPTDLVHRILDLRLAELAAGYGNRKVPLQ